MEYLSKNLMKFEDIFLGKMLGLLFKVILWVIVLEEKFREFFKCVFFWGEVNKGMLCMLENVKGKEYFNLIGLV